jgi:thiol-disulfide isomerase/thioredoxin
MWKTLTASGAVLGIVVAGTAWLLAEPDWDPTPRLVGETLVFEEHLSVRPASIYTPEVNAQMAAKIDESRFILEGRKRREIVSLLGFGSGVSVGAAAPRFELSRTDGSRFDLADLRGRIAVFMFAAMTCPPAREQVPRWEALQEKYDRSDVELFLIYSRERHPHEPGYPEFRYAETDAEKMTYARMLADLTALPVVVDSIEETVLQLYGDVPNAAFVVDRNGTVVFRSTWADSRKIEAVLDALLDHEAAGS